ncbi:MAG: hypothetical protein A2X34_06075 [Elusimicrobia bacterium GWC2_51_8]|nr:MAG: hypothetical protein A2X33_04885 [Elusimicrobia bacterium GWA2_51_34]OGR59006.1 MAG: hypothetical protein A2X34_06075 [Elusimicrobia bacterium GWC2_51_8]OGR86068.1 MAG: hypothetical protein A2021_08615 [Elusimicrobia bacterium GWF2_52_66]HAF95660.1 hypothetical protein [Elusimicrobiota bacterium]HCE97433.1 hypothetical protein [Elusimicrobiota bacterium]
MNETARLFLAILARPLSAIAGLTAKNSSLKAPLIMFLLYSALHALILPWLSPAFIPEAPAAAFGNPFYYYFWGAPLNLFTGAMLAAILPSAASLFSSGRITARVLLAALISIIVFTAASASGKTAAASWLLPAAFIASAAACAARRLDESRAIFAVILSSSAVSLAMLPAEILSIYLDSKILFEIFYALEAIWILWLLVKALGVTEHLSAPRTAAAVLFTAVLCGALIFGLARLLPDYIAAILLVC